MTVDDLRSLNSRISIIIFNIRSETTNASHYTISSRVDKQALRILSYLKDLLVGRSFEQKGDLYDDELAHHADELRELSKWGLFQQLFQGSIESCRQKTNRERQF